MWKLFLGSVLTSFVVAGCGGELAGEEGELEPAIDVATETSALGAGCTFYRPFVWDGPNQCIENAGSHAQLADGQSFSNNGYGLMSTGWGAYQVSCHNGWLTVDFSYCYYGLEP